MNEKRWKSPSQIQTKKNSARQPSVLSKSSFNGSSFLNHYDLQLFSESFVLAFFFDNLLCMYIFQFTVIPINRSLTQMIESESNVYMCRYKSEYLMRNVAKTVAKRFKPKTLLVYFRFTVATGLHSNNNVFKMWTNRLLSPVSNRFLVIIHKHALVDTYNNNNKKNINIRIDCENITNRPNVFVSNCFFAPSNKSF